MYIIFKRKIVNGVNSVERNLMYIFSKYDVLFFLLIKEEWHRSDWISMSYPKEHQSPCSSAFAKFLSKKKSTFSQSDTVKSSYLQPTHP